MRRALVLIAMFPGLLACSEEAEPEPDLLPVPAAVATNDAVSSGTWGVPEYDVLDGVTEPADVLVDRPAGVALARALDRAADVEVPASFSDEARVVLQNDVWGLWQRTREHAVTSANAEALEAAAVRLMRRLALASVEAWEPGFPAAVAPVLVGGWAELESEMPSLQHERMFGVRRVFHVARRGEGERALFSTLVAIDRSGALRVTSIPGELEMLRFEGDSLVRARVFELDRRGLREHGPRRALREVDEVAHIPATGANRFYAVFDPPEPLAPPPPLVSPPCVRCHDDAQMMSLPTPSREVGGRFEALLRIAVLPDPL